MTENSDPHLNPHPNSDLDDEINKHSKEAKRVGHAAALQA